MCTGAGRRPALMLCESLDELHFHRPGRTKMVAMARRGGKREAESILVNEPAVAATRAWTASKVERGHSAADVDQPESMDDRAERTGRIR